MKFTIEPGTSADIDELEKLYDELNDYLAATTNYPLSLIHISEPTRPY